MSLSRITNLYGQYSSQAFIINSGHQSALYRALSEKLEALCLMLKFVEGLGLVVATTVFPSFTFTR